jgi:hypothetical protein
MRRDSFPEGCALHAAYSRWLGAGWCAPAVEWIASRLIAWSLLTSREYFE